MGTRTSPCGWTPDFTGCKSGPCCPDLDDPDNAAIKTLAATLASNILWRLTGMNFGSCDLIVRPCRPETCKPTNLNDIIYWDSRLASRGSGNLGVLDYFPTLVSGQVYNIAYNCGCPMGCCTCRPGCTFLLPGPVDTITEVTVDGETLVEGTDYLIYDNATLAFINGTCPTCQNYDLANGEVGTWSVAYSLGIPVPAELNYAAGLFACELAKSMLGQACALPDRVQAVSRPGVDIAFFDPIAFTNEGLTGLPVVDAVIRALNPYRLTCAPRVWSPDLAVVRRETPTTP